MGLIIFLVIAFALVWLIALGNSTQRKLKEAFPPAWEKILMDEVGFIHALKPEMRERFLRRVQEFMLTRSVMGYQTTVDDRDKLLVASSAVMMTLSFDQWNFRYLDGVVLVDGSVNENPAKNEGLIAGLVRTSGGRSNMVLSKSALEQGFRNMKDKKNVGVHEFAHVLDHADGEIDGIPKAIMPPELVENWSRLILRKIQEINKKRSDINPYGATNESEFFAVVTEYFFERPDVMKEKHPELYDILSKTFRQERSNIFRELSATLVRKVKEKIGRNAPCPCGSGKKFKRCCLNKKKD